MPTISAVCAQLVADGVPVLFADTCSLLDPIRAPFRIKKLGGSVRGAVDLSHLLISIPPAARLVTASFVAGEWRAHATPIADELRKHLAGLNAYAAEFHDTCALLGIVPEFARPSFDSVGLEDRLLDLSRQLLGQALPLEEQDNTNMRAFARAIKCVPPSKKGGEVKDCTIVEECLELCTQLRAAGFDRKLAFCTSNTDDYCEGGRLHSRLAVDFAAVKLGFVTSLPWAVRELIT